MATGMSFTIASPLNNHITKDTKLKCTQHPSTLIPRKSQYPLLMNKSEAHQLLSKQAAWEAHIEKGVPDKEPLLDVTHAVAMLCLCKPWRRPQRSSLEPLYLEAMMNLPLACSMRTLSISETPSTLPLDEHPVD